MTQNANISTSQPDRIQYIHTGSRLGCNSRASIFLTLQEGGTFSAEKPAKFFVPFKIFKLRAQNTFPTQVVVCYKQNDLFFLHQARKVLLEHFMGVKMSLKLYLKSVKSKEIKIILRLFLVCHLLLQTKSVLSQPAINVGGLVIH